MTEAVDVNSRPDVPLVYLLAQSTRLTEGPALASPMVSIRRAQSPPQGGRSLATGQRDPGSGCRDFFRDGSAADATGAARAQQHEPMRSPGSDSDDRLVKQRLLTSPRNELVWTLKREPCAVSQEGPDKGGRLWLTKVVAP